MCEHANGGGGGRWYRRLNVDYLENEDSETALFYLINFGVSKTIC